MQRQGRLWWQFKGGGGRTGRPSAPSCFLIALAVLFLSFSFAAAEHDTKCPPCHFYSQEGGGKCIPVPEGTDPFNDCGSGGLEPRLFCGVEKVCGKNAVCQLRAQPACECNFKTGACAIPPPPPPPPPPPAILSEPELEPEPVPELVQTPPLEAVLEARSSSTPDADETTPDTFIVELSTGTMVLLSTLIALGPVLGIFLVVDGFRRRGSASRKITNFDLEAGYNSSPTDPSELESVGKKARRKRVRKWQSAPPGDDSDTEDNV